MQRTIVPGVSMWSVWQPDRRLFFNSFAIETAEGTIVVDPLEPDAGTLAELEAANVATIVVTNRDHERAARTLAARLDAKIVSSEAEAALLGGPVDRVVRDGETIGDARVVAFEGLKTPGEFGLALPERGAFLVGDALWGDPAGSVRMMPDDKLADPARAALSLRAICARRPEHLLLGDGACLFGNAHRTVWAALEARADVYVNRMNVDEAVWSRSARDRAPYDRAEWFDVDGYIGAEKLGYRVARVLPGGAFSPEHWHACEEELFVVLEGSATLRGPRGAWPLRRGDCVAFPTRPSGSHQIVNDASEPCTMLLVANVDPSDVCYYPNSHKLLIERSDVLVRDRPVLDYYDGE